MRIQKTECSAVSNLVLFAEKYGIKIVDYASDVERIYTRKEYPNVLIKRFLAVCEEDGKLCCIQAGYNGDFGVDCIECPFANVDYIKKN